MLSVQSDEMETMPAPDLAKEHYAKGCDLAWIQQRVQDALTEFQAALDLCPNFAEVYLQVGNIHFHCEPQNPQKALDNYRQAIELSPEWAEAHLGAANALRALGHLPKAIVEYKKAIRFNSGDSRLHIAFAVCLSELGHQDAAIESFREGIRLKPAYGEISARMMLADALRKAGRTQEAIAEWTIVSNSKPVWDYEQEEPANARKRLSGR